MGLTGETIISDGGCMGGPRVVIKGCEVEHPELNRIPKFIEETSERLHRLDAYGIKERYEAPVGLSYYSLSSIWEHGLVANVIFVLGKDSLEYFRKLFKEIDSTKWPPPASPNSIDNLFIKPLEGDKEGVEEFKKCLHSSSEDRYILAKLEGDKESVEEYEKMYENYIKQEELAGKRREAIVEGIEKVSDLVDKLNIKEPPAFGKELFNRVKQGYEIENALKDIANELKSYRNS